MPWRLITLCCLLTWAGLVWLPAPAAGQSGGQTEQDSKLLAAFAAVQQKCLAYSYDLAEQTVLEAVKTRLRSNRAQPPQELPTVQDLQQNLLGDFDTQWKQLVQDATAGLDNDGKLKLVTKLNEFLEKNPRTKQDTQRKYLKALQEDLPVVLRSVETRLIQEQSVELASTLQEVIAAGTPDESQILAARQSGVAAIIPAMTTEVLKRTKEELSQVLLTGAVKALEAREGEVVQDGLNQLDEQMSVFGRPAVAMSKPGLRRELEDALRGIADRQARDRQDDALRRSYGEFAQVRQSLAAEVDKRFDRRLVDAIEDFRPQIEGVAAHEKQALQAMVLAEPPKHHTRAQSSLAAQGQMQQMADAKQELLVGQLVAQLRDSRFQADRELAEDAFRDDVLGTLRQLATGSGQSWGSLQRQLKNAYDFVLRTEIRPAIARQQVAQFAPRLADDTWWPTEEEERDCPQKVTRDALRELRFWTAAAPADQSVLEETWDLWLVDAQRKIDVCRAAAEGQDRLVGAQKPVMREMMRRQPGRSRAEWEQLYTLNVIGQWKQTADEASRRYPELFEATRTRIKEVVAELLDARDVAEKQQPAVVQPKPDRAFDVSQTVAPTDIADVKPPDSSPRPADEPGHGAGAGPGGMGGNQTGGGPGNGPTDQGKGEGGGGEGAGAGQGGGGDGEEKKERPKSPMVFADEEELLLPDNGGVLVITTDLTNALADISRTRDSWFYRIAFCVLLAIILLMACGWYLHVRALNRQIARLLAVIRRLESP